MLSGRVHFKLLNLKNTHTHTPTLKKKKKKTPVYICSYTVTHIPAAVAPAAIEVERKVKIWAASCTFLSHLLLLFLNPCEKKLSYVSWMLQEKKNNARLSLKPNDLLQAN